MNPLDNPPGSPVAERSQLDRRVIPHVVSSSYSMARTIARDMGWQPSTWRMVNHCEQLTPYPVSDLYLIEDWWRMRDVGRIITLAEQRGFTIKYVYRDHFDMSWDECRNLDEDQILFYGNCKYQAFLRGIILKIEGFVERPSYSKNNPNI